MAKDLDDWEQKRVQRFKGEPDGKLWIVFDMASPAV